MNKYIKYIGSIFIVIFIVFFIFITFSEIRNLSSLNWLNCEAKVTILNSDIDVHETKYGAKVSTRHEVILEYEFNGKKYLKNTFITPKNKLNKSITIKVNPKYPNEYNANKPKLIILVLALLLFIILIIVGVKKLRSFYWNRNIQNADVKSKPSARGESYDI